ncbi:MAG: hypothetical protein H0W02_11655 [Ktedonobacteraceae bacterium]|nr:hypothetical protein [Ktedonobacteraceae bacterium]
MSAGNVGGQGEPKGSRSGAPTRNGRAGGNFATASFLQREETYESKEEEDCAEKTCTYASKSNKYSLDLFVRFVVHLDTFCRVFGVINKGKVSIGSISTRDEHRVFNRWISQRLEADQRSTPFRLFILLYDYPLRFHPFPDELQGLIDRCVKEKEHAGKKRHINEEQKNREQIRVVPT